LLPWYDAHARDLPWRESLDPYRVWVSEIMLQQTRVAAVIAHYYEFLRRFPTVEKLAAAREASVLAAWSGLGYYRRARMLHAAAKEIVRGRSGKFPATAEGLRELPGVGRYTAAAIASIVFDEPVAVVDGNVERVLQRILGKGLAGEKVWQEAERLLDRKRPGDFNQAMMELGATVCTPHTPACLTCPVLELCATRGETAAATKAAPQTKREIHYALDYRTNIGRDGAVFLVQRAPDVSLMAGMWELPEVLPRAGKKRVPRSAGNDKNRNGKNKNGDLRSDNAHEFLFTVRHSITVTDYTVRVWRADVPTGTRGEWIATNRLAKVALTGLARKILRKADFMESGASVASSKPKQRNRHGRTGGGTMAALTTGTKAPEFELKTLDGKLFSLNGERARGPVVLAFFKVSCPTCQYAFPFLERLYKAYGHKGVTLVGVSQNDAKDTAAFVKAFGITFPLLLDDTDSYPVSNAYGLTNVPSIFWIAQHGEIEVSSVGWLMADFEEINRRMAEAGKTAPAAVFGQGESVKAFQAG